MTVETPPLITRRYYPGLDLLRFAAALMVMFFHFTYLSSSPDSPVHIAAGSALDFSAITPASWAGWVGVQIFFVISGIVIATSANGASPISFLRSRIARLLPSIWICATISMITAILIGTMAFMHILKLYNGTLLVYPHGFNAVYWTLRIEIAFYAFIFLLLCMNAFRHIEKIAGFMAIASLLFWLSYDASHIWNVSPTLARTTDILRKCMPVWDVVFHYGCFFSLGIYLWLMSKSGPTTARLSIIVIGLVGGCLQIENFSHAFIPQEANILLPVGAWLLAIVVIYLSLRHISTSSHKFIRMLGLATYPLYLVHDFMGATIVGALYRHGLNSWLAAAGGMTSSIIVSVIIARYMEPSLRHVVQLGMSSRKKSTRSTFLSRPTAELAVIP